MATSVLNHSATKCHTHPSQAPIFPARQHGLLYRDLLRQAQLRKRSQTLQQLHASTIAPHSYSPSLQHCWETFMWLRRSASATHRAAQLLGITVHTCPVHLLLSLSTGGPPTADLCVVTHHVLLVSRGGHPLVDTGAHSGLEASVLQHILSGPPEASCLAVGLNVVVKVTLGALGLTPDHGCFGARLIAGHGWLPSFGALLVRRSDHGPWSRRRSRP